MDSPPGPTRLRDRWTTLLGTAHGVRTLLTITAVLGLLLSAGAAAIVWRSAEGHRRTAEELLQGQADFLATQYASSAQIQSWFAVRTQLHAWRGIATPGTPLPTSRQVEARVDEGTIGPALASLTPTGWFRIDAGRMAYLPRATPPSAAQLRSWQSLVDARVTERPPAPGAFSYLVTPDGETIFFTLDRGGVAGLTVPLAQWRANVFATIAGHLRLAADTAALTTVSVRVRAPDGTVLYESDPPLDELACIGHGIMSGSLAASVEVTYPASAVSWVVPGGLPTSSLAIALLVFAALALALLGGLLLVHRALTLALLRGEFTSTMSHELRTPLTQVLLYAETLGRDRPLAPEQRAAAVDVIVREARRLVQMVENVLALSRVARPELRVVRRPERVDQLVRDVLAGFEPMFRQRDVRASTRMPEALEAPVDGDAVRQILINLVDNAVRHGPAGQEITVGADRVNGVVRLSVEDAGPGIPRERRDEAWRPFVRLNNGAGSAGSGIGLAVVHQLALLHGGSARIEDAPGGGARFVIELAVSDRAEG